MSAKRSSIVGFLTLILLAVFHVLVILKVIPADIVWGGKFKDDIELQIMLFVSLILNLIMGVLFLVRYFQIRRNQRFIVVSILMWLMLVLFVLNTVTNIMAETWVEKLTFTPISIFLAFLSLRSALWKSTSEDSTQDIPDEETKEPA